MTFHVRTQRGLALVYWRGAGSSGAGGGGATGTGVYRPFQIRARARSVFVSRQRAGGGAITAPYGITAETDTALALAGLQIGVVGLAQETDTAFALSGGAYVAGDVGLASETDTALALAGIQVGAFGMASETDTAMVPGEEEPGYAGTPRRLFLGGAVIASNRRLPGGTVTASSIGAYLKAHRST